MHFSGLWVIWLTFPFIGLLQKITNIKMTHLYCQRKREKNKVLLCFISECITESYLLERVFNGKSINTPHGSTSGTATNICFGCCFIFWDCFPCIYWVRWGILSLQNLCNKCTALPRANSPRVTCLPEPADGSSVGHFNCSKGDILQRKDQISLWGLKLLCFSFEPFFGFL